MKSIILKVLTALFVGAIVALIFYLCGCFMYADFNIKTWPVESREILGAFALLFISLGMALTVTAGKEITKS
jgi:phosphatidylserine synthase